MGIHAGELRDRLRVLSLKPDDTALNYAWAETGQVWAKTTIDERANLFSSVGIGARGVTFRIRARPSLSLHQAIRLRDRHCFLTAILPDNENPGYAIVKAALCDPVECVADADKAPPGIHFPGILTEKYVGHDQPDFHSEVTTDYVLVTPKVVELNPGSWVVANGAYYKVLTPHLLDPYKNEFEIRRKEDC